MQLVARKTGVHKREKEGVITQSETSTPRRGKDETVPTAKGESGRET